MVAIFTGPKKVIYGEQAFEQLIPTIRELNIQQLFVIYSGSALEIEKKEQLKQKLIEQDCRTTFFEMPKGEPTMGLLKRAVKLFHDMECNGVVAIGGGSALDLAKATAAMAKEQAPEFSQLAEAPVVERYPLIAVPTTAGTGSEATKISVITDEKQNIKFNPGHPALIPDVAILDPLFTQKVPQQVTAFTGLDALTHAIEAYVSNKANTMTDFYAREAIRLISKSIRTAYEEPANIEARSNLLLGSYYAGLAFSNASTNLAHALGRAIGTKWQLPHGQSVAILHPFVVSYSLASAKERYDEIATICGVGSGEQLVSYLMELNQDLGVWHSVQMLRDEAFLQTVEEMTANALSGNGILTNRQIPTAQDIEAIYTALHSYVLQQQLVNG